MVDIIKASSIPNYWPNFVNRLYNKRACPTKNEPQQGISSLEREREGV